MLSIEHAAIIHINAENVLGHQQRSSETVGFDLVPFDTGRRLLARWIRGMDKCCNY
jgi:hypothetical protein